MECKDKEVLATIDRMGYDMNNIISYAVCEQRSNAARCKSGDHTLREYSLSGYRHDKIHRTPVSKKFVTLDREEV